MNEFNYDTGNFFLFFVYSLQSPPLSPHLFFLFFSFTFPIFFLFPKETKSFFHFLSREYLFPLSSLSLLFNFFPLVPLRNYTTEENTFWFSNFFFIGLNAFFLGGGGGVQDNSFTGGNYAFSPYGLASVLVLLYEGSCGESPVQIQRTLSFPWNKFIVRLGFRDIHDRLKVLIIKIQFNFFWRQKFIDLSIDFFFCYRVISVTMVF